MVSKLGGGREKCISNWFRRLGVSQVAREKSTLARGIACSNFNDKVSKVLAFVISAINYQKQRQNLKRFGGGDIGDGLSIVPPNYQEVQHW